MIEYLFVKTIQILIFILLVGYLICIVGIIIEFLSAALAVEAPPILLKKNKSNKMLSKKRKKILK